MSKLKLVMVTWHDAMHKTHGWTDGKKDKHQDDVAHSVGWLVRENKKSLTLAQTDGMDLKANIVQIPMGMVEKVVSLREIK